VVELAAQTVLRRREAAGSRPLLLSTRDRRGGACVRSLLLRTFGREEGQEQEDQTAGTTDVPAYPPCITCCPLLSPMYRS
jgi:hypothetical protein